MNLNPCNFWPLPDYGELFTPGEFHAHVKVGAITPDDGSGYWACSVYEDGQIGYHRSHDCFGERPKWATHIVWFNK